MAPRSRSRAAQGAASISPAPTIADLPAEVLVHVMGLLPGVKERQRAALVCKRFAAAAGSPQLLHEVELPAWSGLDALHSQAAWLARHGHHVRKLSFRGEADEGEDAAAVASATSSCLSIIGSAGQLTDLTVTVVPVCHLDWLIAMRPLQRLCCAAGFIHVSPSIAQLTALLSLELDGTAQHAPGISLPPSITRLLIADDTLEEMPWQVAQLPRLARLQLEWCGYSPDSLDQLAALSGSLTRLEVVDMHLPSQEGLAALTRLQHLDCQPFTQADVHAVAAALPHLTGLTCLMLDGRRRRCRLDLLLPTLGGLSRLQLCELDGEDSSIAGGQAAALPAGPWLRSLRWLCANLNTLVHSTAVLQAATALESVSVAHSPGAAVDWRSPAAAALLDWLASHPPLRRLSFDAGDPNLMSSNAFVVHLMQLWRRRPALLVQAPGLGDNGESFHAHVSATHPF